jgi:DNA invertase Pin-like site-specific DNA recombinase
MTGTLIGYARCSTDKKDLTAQRRALIELGVAPTHDNAGLISTLPHFPPP